MDFTNIPEGATHYFTNNDCWYKFDEGSGYIWNSKGWVESAYDYPEHSGFVLIPKQKKVVVQQGTWVNISEIPDVETWKKCIDAFVKAGAKECEGYTGLCEKHYYSAYRNWSALEWWGDRGTYHSFDPDDTTKQISVKDLLSTLEEPEMKDTFDIKDLKTGMRVTLKNRLVAIVVRDWVSTEVTLNTIHYLTGGYDLISVLKSSSHKVIKVEIPEGQHVFNVEHYGKASSEYNVFWEPVEETQLQKDYNAAIKQLEEAEQAAKDARLAVEKLKPKD